MVSQATHSDLAEGTTELLAELASTMHAVAVPSDTIETMLGEAAHTLGADAETLVLQSAVLMQVDAAGKQRISLHRLFFDAHWSLAQMHDVVEVAHSVADGKLGVAAARAELRRIEAQPKLYTRPIVTAAYAVYSAVVAARVGGGWLEMFVAMLVGLVACAIHFGSEHHSQIELQKTFLAGFAGALCLLVLSLLLPPFASAHALFGGVVLLVPAMVVTIGVHELASGALESGVLRLSYGFLCFVMLGTGIVAASVLWRLIGPLPAAMTPHALPDVAVLALLVLGGLALVGCLQARLQDAPWMIGGTLLAWGTQDLSKHLLGSHGAPLASAFVLGVAAQLFARMRGRTPATVLVPGLLQLAPGFLGTETLLHMLFGRAGSGDNFFEVILVALQLVVGLLIAGVLIRPRPHVAHQPIA